MNSIQFNSSRFWMGCIIAAVVLAPFAIYFSTASSIVSIWNSSETFAHGYIILPISLWLIWKQRRVLAQMTPVPYWPALVLLAACGFGWLLAQLGDVQVVRQYAFVAMIPVAAVALLGLRISWLLAFPLLFLLLAVPFGEIFIDPLINLTADFTVAAVEATGIPILRQGNNFSLPTGDWSVVEACSGVRYLISSFTLGCLYAYLTYRSRVRQLLFVLISIIVPIVANVLRAYMIVMIGHHSGMELATGVDHLVYGWLFFGLVMFLMFWIGSFWREDGGASENVSLAQSGSRHVESAATMPIMAVAIGVIACMAIWPAYAYYLDQTNANQKPLDLSRFQTDWQHTSPVTDWKPHFQKPAAELSRSLQKGNQSAGITILYYRNQHKEAELINSENRLVTDKDPIWRRISNTTRSESVADRSLSVRESVLQDKSGKLLVWHWYWIDGRFVVSDYIGKLYQAKGRLLMQGDDGAAVMVAVPFYDNQDRARETMRDFIGEHLVPLEAMLAASRKQ